MSTQTLEEFHTLIDAELGEDGVVNSHIPGAVRRAVRWLERRHSFVYMRELLDIPLPALATDETPPSNIDLGTRVKSFEEGPQVYLDTEPTCFWDFDRAEWHDAKGGYRVNRPENWLLINHRTIRPLEIYTEDFTAIFPVYKYTDWPSTDFDTFNHYLIDEGEDLLLSQTILYLSPYLRDPEIGSAHKVLRDEALATIIDADREMDFSARDERIRYE